MQETPKISIVTVCHNMERYLQATIRSVLSQHYPNLEYIIVDGQSTDNTVDIVRKYERHLHSWCSEPDDGIYDAIRKGFQMSSGEIMGWINADDLLLTGCLQSVATAFQDRHCRWVQGFNSLADEHGRIFRVRSPRFTRRFQYLNRECFGPEGELLAFGTPQQESTFWRRDLWDSVGGLDDNKYRFAGDFFLWQKFFREESLRVVPSLHGAFRRRSGQASVVCADLYIKEMHEIIDNELALMLESEVQEFRRYQRSNLNRFFNRISRVRRFFVSSPQSSMDLVGDA